MAKAAARRDEYAYRWFLKARWPSTKGVPVCPDCGVIGATAIRRRRFRCTAIECRREFSVTSGTILAIAAEREHLKLEGTAEMNAMHLGGHVRPENKAEDRVDGRHAENQTWKRMAVQALRERGAGNRTLAAAIPGERGNIA